MKVPRDLSGAQLVEILCRDWGYRVVHQEGSHIIRAVSVHKGMERQKLLEALR